MRACVYSYDYNRRCTLPVLSGCYSVLIYCAAVRRKEINSIYIFLGYCLRFDILSKIRYSPSIDTRTYSTSRSSSIAASHMKTAFTGISNGFFLVIKRTVMVFFFWHLPHAYNADIVISLSVVRYRHDWKQGFFFLCFPDNTVRKHSIP